VEPKFLVLGEIMRPHGIRGELRVRIMTNYPERIAKLGTVYLGETPDAKVPKPYPVAGMRMNGDFGLLRLGGISDRTEAERYRGLFVLVDMEHAVPLEAGEFYLYQLIGLRVETGAGEALGTLTEVLETGANDVYLVDSPRYGEILIPVTTETIVKTDVTTGVLIVNLPDGLLPDSDDAAETDD
jgi:16S rRNA processing protein RimM